MIRLTRLSPLMIGAALLAGCKKDAPPTPPPAPPEPIRVTVLVTADENGHLLPHEVDGKQVGGAAEVLGQWVEQEGHCVVGGAHCEPERTIALSTGDHWGGPALSSRFGGQPMAEAMGRMAYAATGLGNHDLAFGREQFATNMRKAAVPVIAANLKVEGPEGDGMRFPGHVVLERDGARIGVVALTYVLGPQRSMAGRYDGLSIGSYEEALAREVPAAWKAGSDAVVVLVDDCPRELAPIFEAHPEWKVSVVAGGHCDGPYQAKAGATELVSPGRRFQQYLKATFTIDPAKTEGARMTGFDTALVPVTGASKPDARLAENLAQWKAKSEAQLGQQIGFTRAGLPLESAQLARWVTTALREATGADAALINKGGLRAGLPKGKVTVGDVYSALPFENSVMLVDLTGAQLIEALGNSEAVSDISATGKRFKDASGKGIDPARKYKVATLEFLYFGGDGFGLEKADPEPTETGMLWQSPVLDWTREQNTNEREPLEALLK